MPLPSSGEISLGSIRVELVNTATGDFGLKPAGRPVSHGFAGATDPPRFVPVNQNSPFIPNNIAEYAMAEWYRYDHTAYGPCALLPFTTPDIGKFFTYYKVRVTGNQGQVSLVKVQPSANPSNWVYALFYESYPFDDEGRLIKAAVPSIRLSGNTADQLQYYYTKLTSSDIYFHIVCFETTVDIYQTVYINICCSGFSDPSGSVLVNLNCRTQPGYNSGSPVNLETTVAVDVMVKCSQGTGYGTVTIPQGSSTASKSISGFSPNDLVLNLAVSNVWSSSYGLQLYRVGVGQVGSC